jgi:hypothetical protein
MSKTTSKIRFTAKLLRPESTAKATSWTFLTLPKQASAKLPSRGMATVDGAIDGFAFRATLEPDGQNGHWLKVNNKMSEDAGAQAGDIVTLEIAPVAEEPEPKVPADLRNARGRLEGAELVVGHYTYGTTRLDSLDHLGQAGRNASAPDQQCLLHARSREAAALLLRSLRLL